MNCNSPTPPRTKDYPAERVRREGDRLIVSFALVGYEAAIRLKITDAYIAFQLESLTYHSPNTLASQAQNAD